MISADDDAEMGNVGRKTLMEGEGGQRHEVLEP